MAEYNPTMPSSMNTSPTRVVKKAFTPALRADSLPYQKPINAYEQKPMISQAIYSSRRLSATTSRNMAKANRLISAKKRE